MFLLKSIFILIALSSTKAQLQKLGKHNFTSEWTIHMKDTLYPPLVVEINNTLIYISFPINYTIKLETSKIVNKPCEVPSAVIQNHKGKDVTPAYAETLKNGKILVTLLESRTDNKNQSNVWLYLIDPAKCVSKVDSLIIDAPIISGKGVLSIVPYMDTFALFMKSEQHCNANQICSLTFDDKLKIIESRKSVLPYDDKDWDILLPNFDPSKGYLYVSVMDEFNMTKIKLLDANLTVVKKTEVNYSGSVAYWFNENNTVSLCESPSDQELECLVLDSNLNTKINARLFYNDYIQNYAIFNLVTGETIVFTIINRDTLGLDSSSYLQHIDLDGNISEPIRFQENTCDNVTDVNAFEMKDGLFCVNIMCTNSVNTRCVSPKDVREF